jgi:N-acyl-D-amino-acid deacylase
MNAWIREMSLDYLLLGGVIIDGFGKYSTPMRADVGIKDERIAVIGKLTGVKAESTIELNGLYVCPGFIDAHSHSDYTLLADNRAEGKIYQGITTEINGNCGLSAAPLSGPAFDQRLSELIELGITERWKTFPEYFSILKNKGIATNVLSLVGHGNLRACAAGYSDRKITSDEMHKVFGMLEDSIAAGAVGLSTGLVYPPGVFADTSEIIEIARKTAELGGNIYATHMRSEGDELLGALSESIKIGFESQIRIHISHLKTSHKKNWGKLQEVFTKIKSAHNSGLRLTCDRYPYTASCTSLDAVLPSWAYEGGREEELKKIRVMKDELAGEILQANPDDVYWEKITISKTTLDKNRWMEGENIAEISQTLKKDPIECLLDILFEEKLNVDAIFISMSEENLQSILKLPYTVIGSDSSARSYSGVTSGGKPHPRGFGTFPRVLGKYVRELGVLSLEQAIHKMTGQTAEIFGIRERGFLKEGFYADITVFDPEKIIDRSDFNDPYKSPEGIYYVFVNGKPVIIKGKTTGLLPGRILD